MRRVGYPRGLTLEGSVYIPPVTLTGYYAGHLKTAPPSRCQLSEVRPDPTRDGGLEPLDGELGVVKRVYALRSRGKTFRAIAEKLNKGGVPTKNGGKWFASTVRYVLNTDLHAKHLKGAKR